MGRFVGWICLLLAAAAALAGTREMNPVVREPLALGPQAQRIIVGFRATPGNAMSKVVRRRGTGAVAVVQASTGAADVAALTQRTQIKLAGSRQLTPSMHLLLLPQMLYGDAVGATLARLRADEAVQFADVDARRYPLALPNDPLYQPTPDATPPASGQWYLNTPSATPIVLEGNATVDLSATDAVSAWSITTGSTGVVVADVDTGVRFDHPDLLRAGPASLGAAYGGRLLPGYDFVGEDYSASGNALGTYLIANDGDGWDPDPSDPGDWISSADRSNALFASDEVTASTWHGTRVMGVYGAITNNDTGIAGMSWGAWILPVRALGKGGGYDSDILVGVQWAAGLTVTGAPENPYPADIINLSLGGSGDCPSDYQSVLSQVAGTLAVLVVAAAGNGGSPGGPAAVTAPANCSPLVPGLIGVAGLRNVGTKVGYSSFGPEVGIAAPAGNCIQSSGDCLRSIDTTTNLGATSPAADSYTSEVNVNLGTSFATPIVSGIAALMRSVNANLSPAQLVARLEASARAFPANTGGLPVCPSNDPTSGECACPSAGQCGSGMVDARSAVLAAEQPIGVIALPSPLTAGSVLDASASVAACDPATLANTTPTPLRIESYAWTASPSTLISAGATSARVTLNPSGRGTLNLTVTDSAGNVDTETVTVIERGGSYAATSTAPTTAPGTSATACPHALTVTPAAPTLAVAFAPASVAKNVASTLTITLTNPNAFALTQSTFNATLPAGLTIGAPASGTTTCGGAQLTASFSAASIALANANIPAAGSCSVTAGVSGAVAGGYTVTLAASALTTAPAGGNAAAAAASLTVTAPVRGGGGALDWGDAAAALALAAAAARLRLRLAWTVAPPPHDRSLEN
jgi:serine protease